MAFNLSVSKFLDDKAHSVFNPVLITFWAIFEVALIFDIMAFEARLT